jgi:hypothetical protein
LIRVQLIDLERANGETFTSAKREGFDAVDLRTVADKHFTGERPGDTLRQAAQLALQHQLSIASVTIENAIVHTADPAAEEHQRSIISAAIRSAGTINASLSTVAPPPVTSDDPNCTPMAYAIALNAVHRCLTLFREEAEIAGVILAVRAPYCGCLLSPVEVRDLIDSVNACSVGICLDLPTLEACGRLQDWLDTLKHRIVAVRLSGDALARYAPQIESVAADPWVAIVDPHPDAPPAN